jgi:hypothetical protein
MGLNVSNDTNVQMAHTRQNVSPIVGLNSDTYKHFLNYIL